MMKIYFCSTKKSGERGATGIVVANNDEQARILLNAKLGRQGLSTDYDLIEIPQDKIGAYLLLDKNR